MIALSLSVRTLSARKVAVVGALVFAAAGCSGSAAVGSELLLAEAPAGFTPLPAGFDSELPLDAAAVASVADGDAKRRLLKDLDYHGGRSRIWVQGEAYVTAVVYRLGTAEGARRLVAFEVEQSKAYVGAYTFAVPAVPGASGYVLSGSRRTVGSTLFCHSVWFARADHAFNVNDCSDRPGATERVSRLAEQQDQAAAAAVLTDGAQAR